MRRLHLLKTNNTLAKQQRRRGNRQERQFTVVNLLLLTFVIACTVPTAVVSYLLLYGDKNPYRSLKLQIATLFATDVLFLKFALDPLIYAWRLAQYRRALKSILAFSRQRNEVDEFLSYSMNNQTAVSFRRKELNREVEFVNNWSVV